MPSLTDTHIKQMIGLLKFIKGPVHPARLVHVQAESMVDISHKNCPCRVVLLGAEYHHDRIMGNTLSRWLRIDKNSLFCEMSIGDLVLCVNGKGASGCSVQPI